MSVATKIRKPMTVDLTKNTKIAKKFEVSGDWNKFESLADAVQVAGTEAELLDFVNTKAEAVVKARANAIWRNLGDDTTETESTISAKMLEQLLSNPFVSERGTSAIREDAKRMNDVRNLRTRYEAGEITIDELLAGI